MGEFNRDDLAAFLLRFGQKALVHRRVFGATGTLLGKRFLAFLLLLRDRFFQSFLSALVHGQIVPYDGKTGSGVIGNPSGVPPWAPLSKREAATECRPYAKSLVTFMVSDRTQQRYRVI